MLSHPQAICWEVAFKGKEVSYLGAVASAFLSSRGLEGFFCTWVSGFLGTEVMSLLKYPRNDQLLAVHPSA